MTMRESPLRSAAARARSGLRPSPSSEPGEAGGKGAAREPLAAAPRADRASGPAPAPRSARTWTPLPKGGVEESDGLEAALHRRLAGRLQDHMRGWAESDQTLQSEVPRLGTDAGGRPLWMDAVGHAPAVASMGSSPPWPWGLRWSDTSTFRSWVELDSNREATRWADRVVEQPGLLNPLLLHGPEGVGRSHLLHAIGQAMLRRGTGEVGFVRATSGWRLDLEGRHLGALDGWLAGATALLIDDMDAAALEVEAARQMHEVVDLALNLGVQVVVVTAVPPSLWPDGPLARLMREGAIAEIRPPGQVDRLAALRAMERRHGLPVEADVLHGLAMEHASWRALENALLGTSVAPEAPPHPDEAETVDLRTTAERVIRRALDVVPHPHLDAGVELEAVLPELDDGWSISVPDAADLIEAAPVSLGVAQAALAVGRDPMVDELLRPHEREKYLVRSDEPLTPEEAVRAAEVLADVDVGAEVRIARRRHALEDDARRLAELEARMTELAAKAEVADTEELLSITDELQAIDETLRGLAPARPARLARLRRVVVSEGEA